MTRNLLPHLGFELGASGRKGVLHLRGTLFWVSLVTGVIFIALTGVFLLVLPRMLDLLYGAEYRDCFRLILIIASSHLVLGFGVIVEPFYIYAGRIKTCVAINLILFGLLVPLGYYLKLVAGTEGVAWYLAAVRLAIVFHLMYIAAYYIRCGRRAVRRAERAAGDRPEKGG